MYAYDTLNTCLLLYIPLQWLKSPFSMFILHGLFSVDTFFFLSGFLVVMVALRTMERSVE